MVTKSKDKSVLETLKDNIISVFDEGISAFESEQSKVNKAFFESLSMEQRDIFCQKLHDSGLKSSKIEKITGKSQPTINRHLNSKNS